MHNQGQNRKYTNLSTTSEEKMINATKSQTEQGTPHADTTKPGTADMEQGATTATTWGQLTSQP